MARAIDWTQYATLKAQGLSDREIARQWGIPWGTFHREKQKREALTERISMQTPPVSNRVSKRVSTRVPQGVPVQVLPSLPPATNSADMTPLLHDILQELRMLTQGLAGRVSPQTPEWPKISNRTSSLVSTSLLRLHILQEGLTGEDAVSLLGGPVPKHGRTAER